MADFQSHQKQANRNLGFLVLVNGNNQEHWDWQVTIAFYAAVHFIHAHLARSLNQHYKTHHQVLEAIDYGIPLSVTKVPEVTYLAYRSLLNLSRRARYLISEGDNTDDTKEYLTYDKHFSRAIKHLDVIIDHIKQLYSIEQNKLPIKCLPLKSNSLNNFTVIR